MAAKKESKSKKTASKTTKKSADLKNVEVMPDVVEMTPKTSERSARQTFNLVVLALVIAAIAMGYMRYKFILVPAVVNGSPIYSWQYVKVLNQTAGKQVIDQLIVEKLISQEADNQNVSITQAEIDAEFERLNQQFESAGGLDAFLATQGLKRSDIQKQLELNIKVQKIVSGQVNVTQEQVDTYYNENKADFGTQSAEEAKIEIKQLLQDQAMQQQVGTWIQDLRSKAQVTVNLPNTN